MAPGAAGTGHNQHLSDPEVPEVGGELREQIREFLDDEVLMRTGRSIGDLASGYVTDALFAGPLAPLLAKLQAVEALRDEWRGHGADVAATMLDAALRGERP